jgi:GAF domain-containing protein
MEIGADPRLDCIVQRAASLAGTSFAAISLVADAKQMFKAGIGIGVPHTTRDVSFCAYVLLDHDPLIVLDATQDPRFADNPLVLKPPGIRFYLGTPIYGAGAQPLGALFVMDTQARHDVPPSLLASLRTLANDASAVFASRHSGGLAIQEARVLF